MFCTNCSTKLQADAEICGNCGTAVVEVQQRILGYNVDTLFCRRCNKELLMNSKVCSNCGTETDKVARGIAKTETAFHKFTGVFIVIGAILLGIGLLVAFVGNNTVTGTILAFAGILVYVLSRVIELIVSVFTGAASAVNNMKKK